MAWVPPTSPHCLCFLQTSATRVATLIRKTVPSASPGILEVSLGSCHLPYQHLLPGESSHTQGGHGYNHLLVTPALL